MYALVSPSNHIIESTIRENYDEASVAAFNFLRSRRGSVWPNEFDANGVSFVKERISRGWTVWKVKAQEAA